MLSADLCLWYLLTEGNPGEVQWLTSVRTTTKFQNWPIPDAGTYNP